jgi:LmbE family N-acetylglucosaminyl deacetylase
MRSHYDGIYLSPHLDDAALSCGGQIFARSVTGQSILIVTLMAGDPPPQPLSEFGHGLHARWRLVEDATAVRRAEDISACQVLGVDYLHWEVPDCIYRVHPVTGEPLYVGEESLFGDVHPAEASLTVELARKIASLPDCGRFFVPLTVGHHVDHQITRLAAERALTGDQMCYYEEYPYVSDPGALDRLAWGEREKWLAKVIPLSSVDLQTKIESIAMFSSQLSTFFSDRDDLIRQVSDYVRSVGGERLWRRLPRAPDR